MGEFWDYGLEFGKFGGIRLKDVWLFFPSVLISLRVISDLYKRIVKGGIGLNGTTVAETSVLSPGMPLILLTTLILLIHLKSGSKLMEKYPVLFSVTIGICYAKISNKLIVAHMTKSTLTVIDKSWAGPGVIFLNQYFDNIFENDLILLWLCFTFVIVDFIFYVTSVYKEISSHLKIKIFKIPYGNNKLKPQSRQNRSIRRAHLDKSSSNTEISNSEMSSECGISKDVIKNIRKSTTSGIRTRSAVKKELL